MKRIGVLLYSNPYWGGTFQYNLSILDALQYMHENLNCEIVAAYENTLWRKVLKKYSFEAVNVSLDLIGYVDKSKSVFLQREFISRFHPGAKKIINEKCDLWIFPSQDDWSYLLKIPALTAIHDLMHRYEGKFPEVSADGEYELREFKYKNICKWSKAILVDSKCGKDQVCASYNVNSRKIFELAYIPPKYIFEEDIEEVNIIKKYNLPEKFIFYPAQFWKHKNHENLIKAISLLKSEIEDINLVLIGSKKNAYDEVKELVNKLNLNKYVYFLGYVPDKEIKFFYNKAKMMVMPTFFGPTNIPPLEAMALGCPLAVSNIYGMPEQVGDAALTFNPNSIEDIAKCIKKLWDDEELCNELIEKGYEKTKQWNQQTFNVSLEKHINNIIKSKEGIE